MPEYTGGSSSITLTGGTLESASVANIDYIGADAYTRYLTLSNVAIGTVNVSSGGSMFMRGADGTADLITVSGPYTYYPGGKKTSSTEYGGRLYLSGGVVQTVIADNEGCVFMYGGDIKNLYLSRTNQSLVSSPKLFIYGGTVSGGSNDGNGGAKEIYVYGGVVSNFTMNANMYAFVYSGGTVIGGTFSGAWIRNTGGTISGLTILNAPTAGSHRMTDGLMSDCTIAAGGLYVANGGKAVDTLVSGANARFRVSGVQAVFEGGTIISGGSLLVSSGLASKTNIGEDGFGLISGQLAVAEKLNIVGGNTKNATVYASNGGIVRDAEVGVSGKLIVYNSGAVIDPVVKGASGLITVSSGGLVRNALISGLSTFAYVSSGGVVNGANIVDHGRMIVYTGGSVVNPHIYRDDATETTIYARLEVSSGGSALGGSAGADNGLTIEVYARNHSYISGMKCGSGGFLLLQGATAEDCIVSRTGGQQTTIRQGGLFKNGIVLDNGKLTISSGTVSGTVVRNGGRIEAVNVAGQTTNNLIKDVTIESGGTVTLRNNGSGGAITEMSGGVVMSGGTLFVSGYGVARDVTLETGRAYLYTNANFSGGTVKAAGNLFVSNGGRAVGVTVEKGATAYSYNNANFSGGMIYGNLRVTNGGKTSGALIQSGGVHHVSVGGSALDTVVYDGGAIRISSGAVVRAQVQQGGSLYINYEAQTLVAPTVAQGAYVSAMLISGTTPRATALMDDATNFHGTLTVEVHNSAKSYTLVGAEGGVSEDFEVSAPWRMFDNVVTVGNTYINPFLTSRGTITVSADGKTLSTAAVSGTSVSAAKSLTENGIVLSTKGSTLNPNDRAAIWSNLTANESISIAANAAADCGDLWLIVTNKSKVNQALFGTTKNQNFDKVVNYYFLGNAEVKNLAAGADYGGSVGGVNLYVNVCTMQGAVYAGGFGTVANDINVQTGATSGEAPDFKKDVYLGALYNANKVDAGTTTSVGNITTGIEAGTFEANLYGASAVKAGTITTTANTDALHTVDDVTLTITGGSATKDTVCIFAGGYATGHDTAKLAPVYTVESVTAKISGGNWGGAHGGRGVFGGAMASDNIGSDGVWAKVGDVDLTISGGTMGNVFGGGWAQKGAKSEVGNVNLTIKGGTIANVFGGGSHSTSGGTTAAGDITITVSGGTITGDIFARGQLDGDATGSAEVVFTGATAFGCNVWGYSYVPEQGMPGVGEGATLSYTGYTGTFSGSIGGFDSITFDGDTKMTIALGEGKTLSNAAWTFDLEERAEIFAENSLLTWAGADFAGDKVTVNFADEAQAKAGWSIADASFTGATFDLWIGGAATAAVDLALGAAIEGTGTAYDGWGFTMEESTLKFKQLA